LRGAQATGCEHFDGCMTLLHHGQALAYTTLARKGHPYFELTVSVLTGQDRLGLPGSDGQFV